MSLRKMRATLTVLLILIGQVIFANMASPYQEGTYSSSVISSRNIDITNETINVTIGKDLDTAHYLIEYNISSDTSSFQIPIIFVTNTHNENFNVFIDGVKYKTQELPSKFTYRDSSLISDEINRFDSLVKKEATIKWSENWAETYSIDQLKYFEADIPKGQHKIRISYTARSYQDVSDWVTEYSFLYALSPAKNWRSFNSLQINIDNSSSGELFYTNLNSTFSPVINPLKTYDFKSLPSKNFQIKFKPQPNYFAVLLISIGPVPLMILFSTVLIMLHAYLVVRYRKRNPTERFAITVNIGSIAFLLAIFILLISTYSIIDAVIGKHASGYHGYTFLGIIYYPIILPFYWMGIWGLDRITRKKRKSNYS